MHLAGFHCVSGTLSCTVEDLLETRESLPPRWRVTGRVGLSFAAVALMASSCSLLFSEDDVSEPSYEEIIENDGPVAYWRGEERKDSPIFQDPIQGRRAYDETEQFHGSYKDSTELEVPGAGPAFGSAFRTELTTDGSLIVPVDAINGNQDFSIELLFRPESQPGEQHGGIFIREQDLQFGFRFGTTANSGDTVFLKVWCHESGCSDGNSNSLDGEEVTGRTLLDFGNWYHLVLVHQVNDHHMAIL